MLAFWQNLPLNINPVIFQIGYVAVRWYSLGYILAILTIYLFLRHKIINKKATSNSTLLTLNNLENILLSIFAGALLGGKIGYIIFYDWHNLLNNPLSTISPFVNGEFVGIYGMSFHGGLLGAIFFGWLACQKYRLNFQELLNFIIPAFPLGYFWGRLGNFMNGELYGRITKSKIGMYFTKQDLFTHTLRHPSQIYEALGEGILLFLILQYFSRQKKWQNKLFPLFLIFYGLIRFVIEFFRQPDPQIGFIFNLLTMGQILCMVMIGVGSIILIFNFSTTD